MFRITKRCPQDFNLICIIILIIHDPFEQKWFTLSVFSPKVQWETTNNNPTRLIKV